MTNRSTHYGDIKIWIEKVIDSCESMEHVKTTRRLITNFDKQLENKSVANYWREHYYTVINPLNLLLLDKENEIFNKKLNT